MECNHLIMNTDPSLDETHGTHSLLSATCGEGEGVGEVATSEGIPSSNLMCSVR